MGSEERLPEDLLAAAPQLAEAAAKAGFYPLVALLERLRPRLVVETESDWRTVGAHLAAGRVREALQAYKGPLLPGSEAPDALKALHQAGVVHAAIIGEAATGKGSLQVI